MNLNSENFFSLVKVVLFLISCSGFNHQLFTIGFYNQLQSISRFYLYHKLYSLFTAREINILLTLGVLTLGVYVASAFFLTKLDSSAALMNAVVGCSIATLVVGEFRHMRDIWQSRIKYRWGPLQSSWKVLFYLIEKKIVKNVVGNHFVFYLFFWWNLF